MKFINYKYHLATIILLLFVLSLYFRLIKWSNIDGMTSSTIPTIPTPTIPTPTIPIPTIPTPKIQTQSQTQPPTPTITPIQSNTTVPSTSATSNLPIPMSSQIPSSQIPHIPSSPSTLYTSIYRQLNQF